MKLHLRSVLLALWLALVSAAFAAPITDLASNALSGGTSTDRFTTGETYILAAPNVAPTLAATAGSPTYNGGSPVFGIFSGTAAGIGSGDSGQTFAQFTFTISNLADGANELLNIDSTAYALGSSATSTSIGSLAVSVAVVVSSGTATVTVSKSGLTAANLATLINGLGYANTATTRTNSSGRVYTLTSIKDSGGTAGGGTDTTTVSIASTVTIVNPPTVASPTSASLAATTATLGGDVTSAGGGTVTARGVVVSLTSANASPQISGTGVTNLTGTGTTGVFTVSATGLTASSAYSYAAYATNAAGTTYSSVGTFTTTAASPGTLEILSKKDPAEANFATSQTGDVAASANPAISTDGRYVAFRSSATNLVANQSATGGSSTNNIYFRDRTANTTKLVTGVNGSATVTAGLSTAGSAISISADGRYVAFLSTATNLISGVTDTNAAADIFLYDRDGNSGAGSLTLVSHTASLTTTSGGAASSTPLISRDGSAIVFASAATDLVSPFTAGTGNALYRYERSTGTITLASPKNGATTTATGLAAAATLRAISDDGRWIAFDTTATDAVASQVAGAATNLFLFDAQAGTTRLLNRAFGTTASAANGITSGTVGLGSDGRYVTFVSAGTDLVSGQTGSGAQVYLYNRLADTITLVSRSTSGATVGSNSAASFPTTILGLPVMSGDGRFIAFSSSATDVIASYTGTGAQYYLYDRLGNSGAGSLTLITHTTASATAGTAGSLSSGVLSPNGSRFAFASNTTDLMTGVTYASTNTIHAYNTLTGAFTFVSGTAANGSAANTVASSLSPVISPDGTLVGFSSGATDFAANDNNALTDLFGSVQTLVTVAPEIYGSATASGTYGTAFSYTITAANTPTSYALATGTLPTGVTLNTSTGVISGTPTQFGSFNVTLTATNAGGTSPSFALAITLAKASVSIASVTASNKTYDGNATATLSATSATLTGVVSGDTVTVDLSGATGTFSDKTVANGKTVTIAGVALGGSSAGNYTLSAQPAAATANITAATLTVTGLSASNKTYDAALSATLTGTAALSGVVSGDTVTLGGTAAGAFATKTVATGKTVTVSGLTISGTDSANYTLTQPTTTANITAATLTVTGLSASNKTYDAALSATLTGTAALSGIVSGDTVTLGGTAAGAFATKTVATGKTVTVSGLTISGTDSANYTLTQPTTTANITAAALTIAGVTASNKAYDGNATATLVTGSAALTGIVSGDTVTLSSGSATATFPAKTIGTGLTVTTSGFALSGADSGNYTLSQPTTTANITAAALTVTGLSASNKTYDAALTATLTGTAALSGVVSGDTVTLGGTAAGAFATKTVATGKTVTVSGLSISGTDSANYTLTQPTATANITAATLTVTGVTASNKTYDATLTATLVTTSAALSGVISGDTVALGTGSAAGAFATKVIGTGKTVTVSGLAISGTDSANYTLTQPTTTANITAAPLTIAGVTASNKTYDATNTATLVTTSAALSGVVSGDTVTLGSGSATGTFPAKTIGTGLTVTTAGFAISGADSGNYTLTQPTTTASITAAPLTVTGLTASNKTYNATLVATLATGSAALSGVVSGDTVTLSTASAAGAFATKVIGTGKTVTVSGLSISGTDSGNYTLTQPTTTANITAAALAVTGVTASNKTYDATNTATLVTTSAALSGVVSGDTVSVATITAAGTFPAKTIGTGLTVTTTGFTLAGADSGNYTLAQPTTTADITAKALTVTGVTATSRTYDKTVTATFVTTSAALSGVVSGDTVTIDTAAIAGTFADKNIGTAKAVTVTGVTIAGADSGNYTLTQPALTADIAAVALTVTGITASNKTYDALLAATINATAATLNGVLSAETVTLSTATAVGSFATKVIGSGKTVTTTGLTLGGADAGNYVITNPTTTADITAAALTIANVTANDRTYDATLVAALNTGTAALVGIASGDTVTLSIAGATGAFATKTIGTAKAVTTSGFTTGGADAGNYTLTQPATTASIAAKNLTVTGITASNKTYDAGLVATLATGTAALVGVVSGDTVTLSSGSAAGAFASKTIGTGKTVQVSGLTLTGTDAGNYTVTQPATTADIAAKNLTVAGTTASDKVYDATVAATPVFTASSLVGVVSGDTVSLVTGAAAATFADKLVATGKTVTLTGLTLGGTDAGNYTLTQPTTTATITAKELTVSGITATSRVYDATTVAALNTGTAALVGIAGADTVTLSTTAAAGVFATKTIGTAKPVTISGLTISGTDSANYTLTQPGTTADVTAKNLTITGTTAANKVYDRLLTAAPDFTASALVGIVSGDTVTLVTGAATASFADKLVATGKTVQLAGLTLAGADAGNYTVTQPATTADITTKGLTVSGITAATRIYDATTVAALSTTSAALVGLVAGDTVTLSTAAATGAFATKVIAAAKTVQVSGLTISGADSANYALTQPTTTADITAKNLTVTGITASSKIYDGNTVAGLTTTGAALVGIAGADTVTLVTGAATGAFANANAAPAKTVQVSGLTLAGADAGNYTVTQPTATANITPANVTIAFTGLSHTYDGTPKSATITATPSSSLSIVYANAGGVAPTNAGSYLVTANVSDTNYSGSGNATLVIAKAAQTVSFSITGTNFNVGSTLGLVASASSGLPVTFSVVSGAASLSGTGATITTAGLTTLRATQAGNANYLPASADQSFTGVSSAKTAQTITFPAIANRITTDTAIVLTATATSGLPVTYTLQSGSPAFLSGNTVILTGSPGVVVVTASQAGNATFAAAPDVTHSFGVNDEGTDTFFGDLVEDLGLFGGDPTRGELLSAPGYRAEATKSGDIAAVVFPGTRRGSLLIVSAALGLNVSLDFVLNPDGTYTVPFTSAGRSLNLTGSLTGTTLVGRLPALRVAFSTQVQARTGLTAGIAGYYESESLNTATGGTASIVGPNGQLLIVASTSTVSTGALGTVSADGKFTVAAPGATISGAVDAPTTTVSGTIVVPGQPTVNFSGLAATTARTDRLINLSSRVRVGPSAGRTLITGFVIGGTAPKRVLLRAVGPALTGFGVQGALSNPRIMLFDGTGKLLLENDDWTGADTAESTTRVGAFALAAGSKDAALFTTLAPGAYTMHIVDGGETGVALAEIYDASVNPNSEYQRLVNISTRGEASTGENVLIGGFIVTGNSPKKVLIRGIGPSLGAFGVPGTLTDPRLRIYRDGALIGENDNWSDGPADTSAAVAQAARDTGAFTLANASKDAALILTLAPGAYTAQVGAADGTTTGVALVEIYEIP